MISGRAHYTGMKINTVSDLIDALGGPSAAARELGVVPSAVTNWRRQGYIPGRNVIKVQQLAKRRKWKLADRVFINGH